jgi:hypothetical protein
LISPDDKTELYNNLRKKYTGNKTQVFNFGLSPIIRGNENGVAGNIFNIYNAYQATIKNINDIDITSIHIPHNVSSFIIQAWYYCPGCQIGFL